MIRGATYGKATWTRAADDECGPGRRHLVIDITTDKNVYAIHAASASRPFSDGVPHARRARRGGGPMSRTRASIALAVLSLCALPAMAQSFRVQCPTSTITHPDPSNS